MTTETDTGVDPWDDDGTPLTRVVAMPGADYRSWDPSSSAPFTVYKAHPTPPSRRWTPEAFSLANTAILAAASVAIMAVMSLSVTVLGCTAMVVASI